MIVDCPDTQTSEPITPTITKLIHLDTTYQHAAATTTHSSFQLIKFPCVQEEYYANGHKVMQELYRDLWGESVSLQNMNLEEKNGHDDTSSQVTNTEREHENMMKIFQNGSETSDYKSSSMAFPSNLQVL